MGKNGQIRIKDKTITQYLTPSELFIQYPKLQELWNNRELGTLRQLKVVRGRKVGRTSILNAIDVINLFNSIVNRE